METILAIVGVSGSGKSTLERNLIQDYPDRFYKLQQFTTRAMRPGERQGDPYVFIQRETFRQLAHQLIGVLGVRPDSLFKDQYGTLPDFVPGKIATIILAEEALDDLKAKNARYGYKILTIGLDVDYDELSQEDREARVGRDPEFIQRERQVLLKADMVWRNGNGKYLNPKEVVEYIDTWGL
jgi:GTPase SAR1 family protein